MALQRFTPAYWAVNFGTSCAASVVVTGSNSILVTCDFRLDTDLIGLYWYSTDNYSHVAYRYETNHDYSTTTLDFDFVLSDVIRPLDQLNAPTLTVNHVGGAVDFVRLSNYVTSGTMTAGHISLPFASVQGGFFSDTPIIWTDIDNLQISIVTNSFDPLSTGLPLTPQQVGTVELNNIVVTGPLLAQSTTTYAPHTLRMTDGYDDSYPQTPTRYIQQMYWLGYRDWYSIYLGISHHHDLIWNSDEGRLVVNPSDKIINSATKAFFTSLLAECYSFGYLNVIISVSYEIVDYLMPTGWAQLDADGNPGLSGWSPPSEFVSPSNLTALYYLADAVKAVFALFSSGLTKIVQIGEPWWWDNSFTNNEPCFYDASTIALYEADMGKPVPTPYIRDNQFVVTQPYQQFVTWLGLQLGTSTHWIANRVVDAFPGTQTALLFYTPQIFASDLLKQVNLPSNWVYPAWDILQLEDYQWIIDGDWASHATTWTTGEITMGYPITHLHYFSGFNLLASTADSVWPNVYLALFDSFAHNAAETWVWARPEIFRDDIIWPPLPSSTDLTMPAITVTQLMDYSAANAVTLRWSDTRGASWDDPIIQSLGAIGQYDIDVQFRRLGMSRDRVFEVSWATNGDTALTGAFLTFDIAST